MSIINSGVGVILLYQALHLSQLWGALGSNLILLQQYIEGVANTHCVLHRPIHRRCPQEEVANTEANTQGVPNNTEGVLASWAVATTQECIGSVADMLRSS